MVLKANCPYCGTTTSMYVSHPEDKENKLIPLYCETEARPGCGKPFVVQFQIKPIIQTFVLSAVGV